jgi:hypothetical protein
LIVDCRDYTQTERRVNFKTKDEQISRSFFSLLFFIRIDVPDSPSKGQSSPLIFCGRCLKLIFHPAEELMTRSPKYFHYNTHLLTWTAVCRRPKASTNCSEDGASTLNDDALTVRPDVGE